MGVDQVCTSHCDPSRVFVNAQPALLMQAGRARGVGREQGKSGQSARRSQCLLMTPKQTWSEHRNERHAHVWRCWKCDWICLTASCYVMRWPIWRLSVLHAD